MSTLTGALSHHTPTEVLEQCSSSGLDLYLRRMRLSEEWFAWVHA